MESLHAWHEFYLLLGTAAATLLALLFVAVSLGTGYLSDKDQRGPRTFMSPVVIHFTSVFFISAVCLVPSHGPILFAVLIGATALTGIAVPVVLTRWVPGPDLPNILPDYFTDGIFPL